MGAGICLRIIVFLFVVSRLDLVNLIRSIFYFIIGYYAELFIFTVLCYCGNEFCGAYLLQ